MHKVLFLLVLLLAGCVSTNQFRMADLQCFHAVSSPNILGTAQVVTCSKDDQTVYVNSYPGVAPIDPMIKASEAAGVGAALHNLPSANLNTTNKVTLCGPAFGTIC